MTGLDWTMILAYFALLAGVVVFTMKRKKIETEKDLFLGGRSVGWLAIGASIFAANIGSEHLIGLAGQGALTGLSMSHWEFHAWVLILMSWVFLPFYYKSGVSTMPEFLERRFGPKARWILSLVSLAASPRCRSSLNEGSDRRPGGFCRWCRLRRTSSPRFPSPYMRARSSLR